MSTPNYCADCGHGLWGDVRMAIRNRSGFVHGLTQRHLAQKLYTERVRDGFVPVTGEVRDQCVRVKVHIEWSPQIAYVERRQSAKRMGRAGKERGPVGFVPLDNIVELYPADADSIEGSHRIARIRLLEAVRICRDENTPWWLAWMLAPLPVEVRVAARVPGVLHMQPFTPSGTPFPMAPVVTIACDVPGGKYVTRQKITRAGAM